MYKQLFRKHLLTLLIITNLTACASLDSSKIKAGPAPAAGFLKVPGLLSEKRERYPFHGVWVNPHFDGFDDYQSIYIAPIDTSHLAENDWWAEATLQFGDIKEDSLELARESEEILKQSLVNDTRFRIADEPGPDTLILEMSIVELRPAKVWLSTIGLAAFVVPLAVGIPAGTAAALGQNGTVAIEGRFKDSCSDEILLMFADRESSKIRILDFTTLTWYGHAEEIMEDWAAQIGQILTTPNEHKVVDSDGFMWLPL